MRIQLHFLCVGGEKVKISLVGHTQALAYRQIPCACRPLESIAETQPQLQPALLSLSAMISQYFIQSPRSL